MKDKPNLIFYIFALFDIVLMIIVGLKFESLSWIPMLLSLGLVIICLRRLKKRNVSSLPLFLTFLIHTCISIFIILLLFLVFSKYEFKSTSQFYLTFFIIFIIGIISLFVFTKIIENYFTYLKPMKNIDKLVNLTTMLSILVTAFVLTRTTFLTIYTTQSNKINSERLSEVEYIESYLYHAEIKPSNPNLKYKAKLKSNTIYYQLNVLKKYINDEENEKENNITFKKSFSQFLYEESVGIVQLKEEGDNKELAERINNITSYLLNGKKDESFLNYSKGLKLNDKNKTSEMTTLFTDFYFFVINIIIYTLNIYYLFLSLTKDVTIRWNPKIATVIYLVFALSSPILFYSFLGSLQIHH